MTHTCPNCGSEIPHDIGQHATVPIAGVVTCPTCGATVMLDKPGAEPDDVAAPDTEAPRATEGGWGEERPESFAGSETIEGVIDELEEKEGGPDG
ncbi:MAG: hypothetical protein ACRDN6_14405 [Gaiellaceae bacterium]